MYINPNSTIKILHNVPLDNTYEHTIYFADSSAQSSYFSGLAKYTFEAQSYQRVKRGYIRVATNAENLYDCNYLMFQNSAFGNKWFYAFIKSVEYINNGVSEIEFEIDVMQTWHFNYNLQQCFVEREHSATDTIGSNTISESLDLGDYICQNQTNAGVSDNLGIVVDSTIDMEYKDSGGGYYTMLDKTIYHGLHMMTFPDPKNLEKYLAGLFGDVNKQAENVKKVKDGVISIRIAPTDGNVNYALKSAVNYNYPIDNIGGYYPHNKKLLTYPFMFLYVTNLSGNSAIYPFELFANRYVQFSLCVDIHPNSPAILYPINYKGIATNKDEAITLNNFPNISWCSSAYQSWLAQAQNSAIPRLSTSISAGVATGALTSNPYLAMAGGVIGAYRGIKNLMTEKRMAELQPPQAKGTTSGLTSYWDNMIDFILMTKTIKPEIAKTIDDYFDKFGYATRRIKKPNRNARPYWTYTKTIGCTITGSVPCDDMRKICSIYDNGITFWNDGNNVGNYDLDNSV